VIGAYLVEFALTGTPELANELLIYAPSEAQAQEFAQKYGAQWGLEVFSLVVATEEQIRMYSLMGKTVTIEAV
jgi:hypothetical protein